MNYKELALKEVEKFKDVVAVDYKYDESPIFECQVNAAIIHVEGIIEANPTVFEEEIVEHEGYKETRYCSVDHWKQILTELKSM